MRPACVLAAAALTACLHFSAATAAAPELELQPTLGAAGLEDAAGVAQELKRLGLSQLRDARLLDAEEAREMVGTGVVQAPHCILHPRCPHEIY